MVPLPKIAVRVGIDEAGRGPVLGPLVVCAYGVPDESVLENLGVADSKKLSPAKRERLARVLPSLPGAICKIEILSAEEIDSQRQSISLNEIEANAFGKLASSFTKNSIFVLDAADVNADRFGVNVAKAAGIPVSQFISEHRADANHLVVAAASILAKVERDKRMFELARVLERKIPWELGSGYPSDAKTVRYIAEYHKKFGKLPPHTRRSWKTVAHYSQSKLEF